MLVIGDEILSGRTRDANAHHLACELTRMGLELREIRMVRDDQGAIVAAVNALRTQVDHLFTSGGIGPTHDDITADAIGAAFGVAVDVREDARAVRLRMARVPQGADLIDNPVSAAPGFSIGNVHVMAGVPDIFRAMLEGLLTRIEGGMPLLSHSFRCEIGEGDLAGPLGEAARRYPDVAMGSYPFGGGAGAILVLRHAERVRLAEAAEALRTALAPLGGAQSETPPS
jgi:molybdenum cofactor synthesis domain-containing protein